MYHDYVHLEMEVDNQPKYMQPENRAARFVNFSVQMIKYTHGNEK